MHHADSCWVITPAVVTFSKDIDGIDMGYFKRFFKRPLDAGYERTVEKGELVAPLADEWLFLLDPANIGELSGYQRPHVLGQRLVEPFLRHRVGRNQCRKGQTVRRGAGPHVVVVSPAPGIDRTLSPVMLGRRG